MIITTDVDPHSTKYLASNIKF